MDKSNINLKDLSGMLAQIFEKLKKIELTIEKQVKQQISAEDCHILLTTEEVSAFLKMPKPTLYSKLVDGTIPAIKHGKRYLIYKDELIKWIENYRKNAPVESDDEINAEILSAQKRKPKPFNF